MRRPEKFDSVDAMFWTCVVLFGVAWAGLVYRFGEIMRTLP